MIGIENIDETIIRLRQQQKSEEKIYNIDFNKMIQINKEEYAFERKLIWKNQISIFLPTGFCQMEEEVAREKYPLSQRPNIIMTNKKNNINFTFSIVEKFDQEKSLWELKEEIKEAILLAAPANLFYEEGKSDNPNLDIWYHDFKSFCLDGQIYNMMYIFRNNTDLILANFNCPFEIYESWRSVLFEIISSIKIEE